MKKTLLLLTTIITIIGCNAPTSEQYNQLQKELTDCKKTVQALENTPEQRLLKGQRLISEARHNDAIAELNQLVAQYPESTEATAAKKKVFELEELIKKQAEIELRKKTLGFKILKEANRIKVGEVSLSFTKVGLNSRWIFDNYGDEYRYRNSERGTKFITARISISSESKNPLLPPVLIYSMKAGKLHLLGVMEYRFVRWEDYGSYLGNNADYGNDFSHTKTIPFSMGVQINNGDLDGAVFVVVKKDGCFVKTTDRFGNPPVSYDESGCSYKQELTVDDFESEYVPVKVFNRNRL